MESKAPWGYFRCVFKIQPSSCLPPVKSWTFPPLTLEKKNKWKRSHQHHFLDCDTFIFASLFFDRKEWTNRGMEMKVDQMKTDWWADLPNRAKRLPFCQSFNLLLINNPWTNTWLPICWLFDRSAHWTYLQLPIRQWGAGNVYLLVLSSWKVNIAENSIAVMGL